MSGASTGWGWRHHQCLIDFRLQGSAANSALRRGQGRADQLHNGTGTGTRAKTHSSERHCARIDRVSWRRVENRKLSDPELYQRTLARIPWERFGTPEDIARVALFLASDMGSG